MPVFDTAAAFRASRQPGYLEKKALRASTDLTVAQTAGVEKTTELADTQEARLQQQADTASDKLALEVKKNLRDLTEEQASATADAAAAAQVVIDEGGSEEDYMDAFGAVMENNGFKAGDVFPEGATVLPPEIIKAIVDGSADEYRLRGRTKDGEPGYAAKDTYIKDGKEYHMWYDDAGTAHKTDILAKDPSGSPVDFEPPNSSEREHAEKLIGKSTRLSALDSPDDDIARDILASNIRQLQAAGFDLEEASFMAVAALEKKVKDEPGMLWGKNQVLDLAELPADQYKAEDGYIYKDDGNGGFQRVD